MSHIIRIQESCCLMKQTRGQYQDELVGTIIIKYHMVQVKSL